MGDGLRVRRFGGVVCRFRDLVWVLLDVTVFLGDVGLDLVLLNGFASILKVLISFLVSSGFTGGFTADGWI